MSVDIEKAIEKKARTDALKMHLLRTFEAIVDDFFASSKIDAQKHGFDEKEHYKIVSVCLAHYMSRFIARTHLRFKVSPNAVIETFVQQLKENTPRYVEQLKEKQSPIIKP